MSQSELICNALRAKGIWNKNSCFLCRKINRDKCKILSLEKSMEAVEKHYIPKPKTNNQKIAKMKFSKKEEKIIAGMYNQGRYNGD